MLWLSRLHFDLADPWEHVNFQVRSIFDVVGGAGWQIRHPQSACELWLVREGSVEIALDGQQARVEAPGIALLHPSQWRDTHHIAGAQLSILGFSFDAVLLGALDLVELLDLPIAPDVDALIFQEPLMSMVEERRQRRAGYSLALHALGQLTFVKLLRELGDDQSARLREKLRCAQSPDLAGALQLIAMRWDTPLDVAQLAQAAHLSPKHFGARFHQAMGLTPMEYLRKFRLNRARDLLAGGATAANIAAECGLGDAAYFSRAFKREFGLTPSGFRHQLKNSPVQKIVL